MSRELGGVALKFIRLDLSNVVHMERPPGAALPVTLDARAFNDMLVRGVPVYRDDKLISGWPLGSRSTAAEELDDDGTDEQPAPYLECDSYSIETTKNGELAVHLFDDGSAWTRDSRGRWKNRWQPAVNPNAAATSSEDDDDNDNDAGDYPQPTVIAARDLRRGDVFYLGGVQVTVTYFSQNRKVWVDRPEGILFPNAFDEYVFDDMLEWGMPVFREGELISGWGLSDVPGMSRALVTNEAIKRQLATIESLQAEVQDLRARLEDASPQSVSVDISAADSDEHISSQLTKFIAAAGDTTQPRIVPSGITIRSYADVERIVKLEAEVAAWHAAANIELVPEADSFTLPRPTPVDLIARLKELYSWAEREEKRAVEAEGDLAAAKRRLAVAAKEVPPLDKWRVLITASKILQAIYDNDVHNSTDTRYAALAAVHSITAVNNGELDEEAYPVNPSVLG